MADVSLRPGEKHRRRGLWQNFRTLLRLIRAIDVDELRRLIARFDERQDQLEQTQQNLEASVKEAQSNIHHLLQLFGKIDRALNSHDPRLAHSGTLNIKNLWYELGRSLSERDLTARPRCPHGTRLRSKLCNQADFTTDWFLYWCGEMHIEPYYHRKFWELCYIAQALFAEGMLNADRRCIGFGCGEEPLPSLFAKYGVRVLATDLDPTRPETYLWRQTNEYAGAVEAIRRPDICPEKELLANIAFRPVDMNSLPPELHGQFDFCWSACALEHLGSLENGLKFIENSVRTLKAGGVAVHTTEFTLNDGDTIDHQPTVLFQRQHLEDLANRLRAAGHEVAEFDFDPGQEVLDRFVDLPPFQGNELISPAHYAHLKLLIDGYACTSVGIIIKASSRGDNA